MKTAMEGTLCVLLAQLQNTTFETRSRIVPCLEAIQGQVKLLGVLPSDPALLEWEVIDENVKGE